MKTLDQIEKLKQLAVEAARDAAMPQPEDYRIHRVGKEIRAKLKAAFPAADFYIASSDGFDTMYGEFPPMIELRWNDEPSRSELDQALCGFIEEWRKDFYTGSLATHAARHTAARSTIDPANARAMTSGGEHKPYDGVTS
jgi:hypothetical protein